MRHTKAVETVIQAAESPIRVGDLAAKLTAEFPETPESVIEGMLAELVAQRILVTSLHPPMTATDTLGHVVGELAAVGADAVPRVAELFHDLRDIHLDLSRHNRLSSPAAGRDLRISASARMAAISTTERPVTVDLRVDCALVLPHAVAREAETAATALARLTPHPFGLPTWQDYHGRVVERYGTGALVPVLEILNADTGLGFPAGYRDARLTPPPVPGLSERDVALLALAQKAAMDHSVEVVLDVDAIANLAAEGVATAQVAPHRTALPCSCIDTGRARPWRVRARRPLQDTGHIASWVDTIYEPELYAFGGAAAMDLAHHLFHSASRHILAYLNSNRATPSGGRSDQRRELSILLCSILMRGAGQGAGGSPHAGTSPATHSDCHYWSRDQPRWTS